MHHVFVPNEKPQRYFLVVDAEKRIGQLVERVARQFDLIPVRVHRVAMLQPTLQMYGDKLSFALVGSLSCSVDAVAVATAIQHELPDLPLIVMSCLPPEALFVDGDQDVHVFGFLPKPFRLSHLQELMIRVQEHKSHQSMVPLIA